MTTDLFVTGAGVESEILIRSVPPDCRRPLTPPRSVTAEGNDELIESPTFTPRSPAHHFVPAFAVLSDQECSVRFELSVEVAGEWSPWVASAALGPAAFSPLVSATMDVLRCAIDVFTSRERAARVRSRIRVRTDRPLSSLRWLATLSACDLVTDGATEPAGDGATGRRAIDVPPLSQMETPASIRHRICSPTSVAMVLARWGRSADPAALAAEMFHPGLDLYGVWPAAIRAAGRRGIGGYLLRFPGWAPVTWCLENGLPIVASVRYEAGELTGAAMPSTDGHLLVLTGEDGDQVLVNDPAAPTRAEVPRRYRREELRRVWLGRAGVGYVFFEP